MKRNAIAAFTVLSILMLLIALPAFASQSFYAGTDRVSYTGAVTRYSSLSDAQDAVNGAGPYAIPDRATEAPFNTGYRDVGVYFSNNAGAVSSDPRMNIFLTSWWYSTVDNTNGYAKDDPDGDRYYSGWGNPNNTNTGFTQLYDADGDSRILSSGDFGGWDGTNFTTFTLHASGENADYDEDYARLWHAPNVGGAAALTKGIYHAYDLNVTFGGLMGQNTGSGWIESTNHPDSVTGTFYSIFENTNTEDLSLNGFYVTEFTFGMDNWAFGQGDALLNGDFAGSYFAEAVPAPGALWLLGSGLLALVRIRRRN